MVDWAGRRKVLYTGGTLYAPGSPFATALLIDGDTIAWIGDDAAAASYRDVADEVVVLNGQLITPGFVDAHVHATNAGILTSGVDLRSTTSATDLLDRVQDAAKRAHGAPILGHGWDESGWQDKRLPTREELDRASWGSVVFLSRIDVHSALASSALIAQCAQITDAPGFEADGRLRQRALAMARTFILSAMGGSLRLAAQRNFRAHAATLGIVLVHEMANPSISSAEDLADLLALAHAEPGPLVSGYWGVHAAKSGIEQARELGAVGVGGDLLIDGSLGSRTACLNAPYTDDGSTSGELFLTADEISEHLIAASLADMQSGFHVIGDHSAALVTEAVQHAAKVVGIDRFRSLQHRLEHLEMVTSDEVAVLADHGVVASVQPAFQSTWGDPGGMYEQRLGQERAAAMNPWATFVSSGMVMAFGSDAPVTPLGPWAAVRDAAAHQESTQRISPRAAFSAHTRAGWRAIGSDGGVLEPGSPAHLVVWDAGALDVRAPDERIARWSTDPRSGVPGLPDLSAELPRALRTIVAGTVVFDSGELDQ
jgi:predicted amidohydrolase YtcJ